MGYLAEAVAAQAGLVRDKEGNVAWPKDVPQPAAAAAPVPEPPTPTAPAAGQAPEPAAAATPSAPAPEVAVSGGPRVDRSVVKKKTLLGS